MANETTEGLFEDGPEQQLWLPAFGKGGGALEVWNEVVFGGGVGWWGV